MGSTTIFYLYWVRSYAHSKVSLVPSILPYLPLSPLLASVSPTCLCLPCFSLSPLSVPIHPVCPDPPRKVCWSINAEVNRAKDLGSVGQIRLKTLSTPSDIHTKNIYLFLRAWTWCPKSPFLSQSTPWQMWCFILQFTVDWGGSEQIGWIGTPHLPGSLCLYRPKPDVQIYAVSQQAKINTVHWGDLGQGWNFSSQIF